MTERELLFSEVLDCDRVSLYQRRFLPLDKEKSLFISSVLKRRCRGEPLQYILGKTEFMGLEFKVNPAVLIPRPETEILVESALKQLSPPQRLADTKILDLGTGSGNIAISLAKSLPGLKIDAVDISEKALSLAQENAKINQVKINFILGDLFKNYDLKLMTYDFIISNPPYISTAEIDNLEPEISYEPRLALDGGQDGLDFYRRIIKEAPGYLRNKGFLILELGFNQQEEVKNIFKASQDFTILEVIKDYSKIERVVIAQKES